MYNGSIITQSYDATNNSFGAPQVLVPFDPSNNYNNYNPAHSPVSMQAPEKSGEWIVFNRAKNQPEGPVNSAAQPWAEVWVVKADGSQPPIKLDAANLGEKLTNSWPVWAPFESHYGPNNETVYWIAFSSARPFGNRLTAEQNNLHEQIWMTAFFPERARQGQDPSGPAFRLPLQNPDTGNRNAQWTQKIVPIGSLL